MALTKRNYVDGQTVITAQNLNDIQDNVRSNLANVTYNSSSRKLQKVSNAGTSTDILTLGSIALFNVQEVTT